MAIEKLNSHNRPASETKRFMYHSLRLLHSFLVRKEGKIPDILFTNSGASIVLHENSLH
jgi:hypothetical protein